MAETRVLPAFKLHRPFRFYDPEVVAVLTLLLGLFQMLLGFPVYYMSTSIKMLYMCPVFVGAAHVTVGSFALACERNPSKHLMKSCLYSVFFGLLVGISAIAVYSYALDDIKSMETCSPDEMYSCPKAKFVDYFCSITALLLVYDMAALILQGFLSFSAIKGLKMN
ncbi:uncharacterized protein si:dkey-9i23.16 [Trichomycterus rosablanca]|uniref:uncharacterized protein si:dkey-9i23.16 n=1 Tax=Trichomycterus rosablanca TaxID=2290929 RepID=UPI002F35E917